MYKHPIASWLKHLDFIIIDFLALNLSFLIAYFLRFGGKRIVYDQPIYFNIILVLSLAQLAISLMIHTHDQILRRSIYKEMSSTFLLALMDLGFVTLYTFSLKISEEYSRLVIYYMIAIFWLLDFVFRSIWKVVVINYKVRVKSERTGRAILVYTTEKYVDDIVNDIKTDKLSNLYLKNISVVEKDSYDEVCDYIVREWIDEVFVYLPNHTDTQNKFLSICREMGITIHLLIDIYSVSESKRFVETLGNHTVITTANNYLTTYQEICKRLMDIVGGLIGTFITFILFIFVAPIIKIQSPGPAIYKQTRIGKNGKQFTMYKFRSMYVDADDKKKEYMAKNKMDGHMFKLDFDPRIIGNVILPDGTKKTGVGQFIRKTSIDEFPQFINVLKGDMSLVGTRPPTVDEWEKYEYHHRARLSWKPGITGLWQVSGRSTITDFETIVKLDTDYICNFKLTTDIKIIFKTILKLFSNNDAM